MEGGSGSNRQEMVEAAIKFMKTPKVYGSPWDEQKAFLVGKGLTEQEIGSSFYIVDFSEVPSKKLYLDEARQQVPPPPPNLVNPIHGGHGYAGPPPPPPQNRIMSFAQSAVIIGAVSYTGYKFLRSYVLPRFFDIPDPATEETRQLQQQLNNLQNSMKLVIDSVSQTAQTGSRLAMQQEEITKALLSISNRDTELSRVESGISTIRSLLLSHNQFAPIHVPPLANGASNPLPSWQRAPPTNFAQQNGEIFEKNENSAEESEKEEPKEMPKVNGNVYKQQNGREEEVEDFQDVSE